MLPYRNHFLPILHLRVISDLMTAGAVQASAGMNVVGSTNQPQSVTAVTLESDVLSYLWAQKRIERLLCFLWLLFMRKICTAVIRINTAIRSISDGSEPNK